MKCIISGLDTSNKHKNAPIHENVMELARLMMVDEGVSMSVALKTIAKLLIEDIGERIKGESNGSVRKKPRGTKGKKGRVTESVVSV